jgi:hypothetical protein
MTVALPVFENMKKADGFGIVSRLATEMGLFELVLRSFRDGR